MRAAKILILSCAETEDKKAYLDRKAIESMKERYDDNIQVTYDINNLQDVDAVCVANDIGYFQPNAVRDPKWRDTMRKVSEKCEKVFSVAYAVPELEKQHFTASFKVKVEGSDLYLPVKKCAITANESLLESLSEATELDITEGNLGLAEDAMPYIRLGYSRIINYPLSYTTSLPRDCQCRDFFEDIMGKWVAMEYDPSLSELKPYTYLFVESEWGNKEIENEND